MNTDFHLHRLQYQQSLTFHHSLTLLDVYASYQATEKLSFHARGELLTVLDAVEPNAENTQIWSLTGTVQYDLWKNVISRLEARWDFGDGGVVSNRPWVSHAWAAPGDYVVELRAYNESEPAGAPASTATSM